MVFKGHASLDPRFWDAAWYFKGHAPLDPRFWDAARYFKGHAPLDPRFWDAAWYFKGHAPAMRAKRQSHRCLLQRQGARFFLQRLLQVQIPDFGPVRDITELLLTRVTTGGTGEQSGRTLLRLGQVLLLNE